MKNKKILKSRYSNDGFAIIRKLISPNEIKSIKIDLSKHIEKQKKILKGRDINFTKDGSVNSIHMMDNWKWTKKIQNDPKLKNLAEFFLDEKPVNYGAELFAKPAKTGRYVPAHQDNYYWAIDDANALTFWIALDKTSKKNGGIYYYKKTNQLGLLEHAPSFAPGSSQTLKYPNSMKHFKKVIPSLMPGDCIVHNVLVVHGSEKNTSNEPRMGWTVRYKSIKSKKDKFQEKKYLEELEMQIKGRQNARI